MENTIFPTKRTVYTISKKWDSPISRAERAGTNLAAHTYELLAHSMRVVFKPRTLGLPNP